MSAYIQRRLLLALLTAVIVSFLVFVSVRLIPGSVVDFLLSGNAGSSGRSGGYTHVDLQEFRARLGLTGPVPIQYLRWGSHVVRGDFGRSLVSGDSIGANLVQFLPVSVELGLLSVVVAVAVGMPIGLLSAIKQDTWMDYLGRSFAIGLLAIPGYWLAVLAIVFGAIWLNWSPPIVYIPFTQSPWGNVRELLLPALLLGVTGSGAASIMRLTRTAVLDVLREDYVRTARAKGLPERAVITRHVLRTALLPVITVIGLSLGYIIGGTVIFEQIFNLPGIGRYLFLSVNQRDYPAVQAVALIFAVTIILANLVTDITYGIVDPRIRYR